MASAARFPKDLNSSLKGNVNSAGCFTLSGRTRTVIVTSVSSTTQTFHLRPLHSMVGFAAFMFGPTYNLRAWASQVPEAQYLKRERQCSEFFAEIHAARCIFLLVSAAKLEMSEGLRHAAEGSL